ncbi:GNAT family N-acetyltransferase [Exiguobacterium profundum]|uniref:GNAT family N-acetyltransferase n=1 Tax=Exiguobacterium profundum TaxID=307643 RepID=UPI0028A20F6D|nr:GNAT family N-acetyltransferase [Exiguobacterium profundum]
MNGRQEIQNERRNEQTYGIFVHKLKGDGTMSTTSSFIVKDVTNNFKDFEEDFFRLYRTLYGDLDQLRFKERLYRHANPLVLLAFSEEQLVGFKIGYEAEPYRFYSWAGGVHPDFQKHGIGRKLMDTQLEWVEAQGFHSIRTKARNTNKGVIILNLLCGYDIMGAYTEDGEPRIMMEKQLNS